MSFARSCKISVITPICPRIIHRTKPADDLRLFSFQSWQYSPSWPTETLTGLLSQELPSPSPPHPGSLSLQSEASGLFQPLWDNIRSCWPVRMNEGLRHGGSLSPIFTTTEAVHDRCLPTCHLLLVRRLLGNLWTSRNYIKGEGQWQKHWHRVIYPISTAAPTYPALCIFSVKASQDGIFS